MPPPSWLTYEPVTRGAQQTLAWRVRRLCTALDKLYDSCFSLKSEDSGELALGRDLFPILGTLERLELLSAPDPFEHASGAGFDAAATPPLPRLRGARLLGYVPASIVRRILRSAATLGCLELGALNDPLVPGDVPDERYAARPLVLGLDEALAFPRLTHSHLCGPSECDPENYRDYDNIAYPRRAIEGSLRDRARLPESAQVTVKTFVLERRMAAENQDPDGHDSYNFVTPYGLGLRARGR
ncbi:hypothetical protein DL770_001524 [Monosporascus sp. CRB-9-2]|nr:hypothetical protein DL770_001524 [Monosporascus sp. CRB-9-2]